MHTFLTQRRIEFADTDMAGIVHFSRFFVFMETAEHEFQRALGSQVHFEYEGEHVGWPRVSVNCDYHKPARLGDVLDIQVRMIRKGRRSLTFGFQFRRDEQLIADGRISCICCVLGTPLPKEGTSLRSIPIPGFLADKIEEAPSSGSNP